MQRFPLEAVYPLGPITEDALPSHLAPTRGNALRARVYITLRGSEMSLLQRRTAWPKWRASPSEYVSRLSS